MPTYRITWPGGFLQQDLEDDLQAIELAQAMATDIEKDAVVERLEASGWQHVRLVASEDVVRREREQLRRLYGEGKL